MTTIRIDKNLMVPMRDGVRLATDVYRLDGTPRAPVLLTRTPYNKDQTLIAGGGVAFDILRAVQAGYAVTIQDVRGRFASEGAFMPHFQERHDGADTIAWVADQPWSSGIVGGFGGSYLGGTQWLAAREQPTAFRAMASAVAPSNMDEGMAYQGGAHVFHPRRWAAVMTTEEIRRRPPPDASLAGSGHHVDVDAILADLPLAGHPLLNEFTPWYRDWLSHSTADTYWHSISPCAGYEQIAAPVLNISGWYDIFLSAAFENYRGMRQRGGSEAARANSQVIIGPWSHSNFTGSFPEREFGPAASSDALDLTGLQLRWFDRWLTEFDNGVEQDPPVTLFVMGVDRWRSATDWPLPETQYRPYYLHSGGAANSSRGDGLLSPHAPAEEPADVYLSDPHRPVPTIGGQVILPGSNAVGPRDQRAVEARDDVLVYSTTVLDREVDVTGPVELRLFAASSGRDTDFTAKPVDVYPDGRAIVLTEGILRARYRRSLAEPHLLEPDAVSELTLDLWATANVFLPGHRIRLEVSSSNFPRFGRNSNTGGEIAMEAAAQYRPAINRVFHDGTRASCLVLPVIER
jgi:putative CocE/NonD family hydrolase